MKERGDKLTIASLEIKTVSVCLWITRSKSHCVGEVAGHASSLVTCTSDEVTSCDNGFVFWFCDGFGESLSKCLGGTSNFAAWLSTLSAYSFSVGLRIA